MPVSTPSFLKPTPTVARLAAAQAVPSAAHPAGGSMGSGLNRRLALAGGAGWMGLGVLGSVGLVGLAGCSGSAKDFSRLLTRVTGVRVGPAQSAQQLVVWFDTRCGYCVQLWRNLLPAQDRIAQLWVPVAILSPQSRGEALALLSSDRPQDWLAAHMAAPAVVKPSSSPAGHAEAALASNLATLDDVPGSTRSVPQSVGMKGSRMQVMRGALPLQRLQGELGWG
jgi:hypothetical protein